MEIAKKGLAIGIAAVTLMSVGTSHAQRADEQVYNIPAQDLKSAIVAVTAQAGYRLYAFSADVKGKRGPAVKGRFTVEEALRLLLEGSGLYAEVQGKVVQIRGRSETPRSAAGGAAEETSEIVVTGSHIRGAPSTSPVTSISRLDAQRSGQTDLGQLIRDLPQNFGGGQNPTIAGPGQGGTQNTNGSSALNLRGLGPDASLTLINGHRMAFDAIYQGVDISAIPLIAIEKIDVVADGASALYGSDAVGGVANVILRRRMSGVFTSARFGASTDGGAVMQQYSAAAGPDWQTGAFVISADYQHSTEITGRHRSYTRTLSPDSTTIPGQKQLSFVVAGQQAISDIFTFEIDGQYMHRSTPRCWSVTTVAPNSCYDNGSVVSSTVDSWAVSPSLKASFENSWDVRLSGTYSSSSTSISNDVYANGVQRQLVLPKYVNDLGSVEIGAEGPLVDLPGGAARLAVGAGYRVTSLDLDSQTLVGGAVSASTSSRETRKVGFAYAELFLPLASPENSVSFAKRLNVVAALRYEDHRNIGRVATPKLGLVYSPVEEVEFKTSWGKSFKTPTLYQTSQPTNAQLVDGATYVPGPPSALPVLYLFGGSKSLGPEKATTWSISTTITPALLEGMKAEIGYFRIRYRDRVASPVAATGNAFQPVYSDFVRLNPNAQEVLAALNGITGAFTNLTNGPFDPGAVSAIFLNKLQNVSLQSVDGVDASISYLRDFGRHGRLSLKASASYLDSTRRVTADLPTVPQAGVVFTPPHWRGRLNGTWERDNVVLSATLSHIGKNEDNRRVPVVKIDSFTSLDAVATIRTEVDRGMLANAEWRVGVQNLFNEKPAYVRPALASLPAYDSLNHSSLGRVVSLTLSKAW